MGRKWPEPTAQARDSPLVVIGKDGNVDLQTSKITPAQYVLDVITNSYAAQVEGRK